MCFRQRLMLDLKRLYRFKEKPNSLKDSKTESPPNEKAPKFKRSVDLETIRSSYTMVELKILNQPNNNRLNDNKTIKPDQHYVAVLKIVQNLQEEEQSYNQWKLYARRGGHFSSNYGAARVTKEKYFKHLDGKSQSTSRIFRRVPTKGSGHILEPFRINNSENINV